MTDEVATAAGEAGAAAPRGACTGAPVEAAQAPASASDALVAAAMLLAGLFLTFNAVGLAASWALPSHPRLVVLVAEVAGLALPALALLALMRRAAGLRVEVGRRRPAAREAALVVGLAVVACAGAWAISAAWLAWLEARGWSWVAEALARFEAAYGPILAADGPLDAVLLVAVVSLAPAACEELAFRGALQGVLATRLSAAMAVTASSVAFAAFHFDVIGLPARIFLGACLGVVYLRTRSLGAAMLAHALNNALLLVVTLAAGGAGSEGSALADPVADWLGDAEVPVALAVAAVALPASALLLRAVPRAPGRDAP